MATDIPEAGLLCQAEQLTPCLPRDTRSLATATALGLAISVSRFSEKEWQWSACSATSLTAFASTGPAIQEGDSSVPLHDFRRPAGRAQGSGLGPTAGKVVLLAAVRGHCRLGNRVTLGWAGKAMDGPMPLPA